MKRKVVMFLTCLFIGIGLASGQNRTVRGNVTSAEDGMPWLVHPLLLMEQQSVRLLISMVTLRLLMYRVRPRL